MEFNFNKILYYFTKGNERSIKAKKNIVASFLFKGLNILFSLILIRLSLDYLDELTYGIFLTLFSIVEWFTFFNIGLGNGLRNKFAEAKAVNDTRLIREYVSTTYITIFLIISILLLFFFIINPFINWIKILNAPETLSYEINYLVFILIGSFSIQFVLKVINSIFQADQKPAFVDFQLMMIGLIKIIFIFILLKNSDSSILLLGFFYGLAPVIILLAMTLWAFNSIYRSYLPSLKYFNANLVKELSSLGLMFFLIQIGVVVIFSTDNIIIAQLLGPSQVTTYSIARKYFNLLIVFFSIINSPFWSAITDAYARNDFTWLKNSINSLKNIWFLLILVGIIMLILSNKIYDIWLSSEMEIPIILSFFMLIFALISTWNFIFGSFLNGVGKIKLQMYLVIIGAIINIPLSILFVKYLNVGSWGVILASCVSLSFFSIIGPIQYRKIINKNAVGLWKM